MPTVCLCMIVKNESKVIERLLESVASEIDCYQISDTGSTDNTKDLIREFMQDRDIPGEITDDPWENFGKNRTIAVQNAENKADYLLMADADFTYTFKDNWKDRLSTKGNVSYYLWYEGNLSFCQLLLVCGKKWEYVGVTHEYHRPVGWKGSNLNNYDVSISHKVDGANRHVKFSRDIKLLQHGLVDEPNNSRYVFYLANSYYDSKEYALALESYERRIEIGGYIEETYYAMYRKGCCLHKLESAFDKAQDAYLKAWNFRPSRLEALYEVVKHYRPEKSLLGYCYGMMAYPGFKSYPEDKLFVNKWIHQVGFVDELAVCSCYSGNHRQAVELGKKLTAADPNDKRFKSNMDFSLNELVKDELLREVIGGHTSSATELVQHSSKHEELIQEGSVLYINLKNRTDRREQMEAELKNIGWPIERLEASEPEASASTVITRSASCTSSHIRALELLYSRNLPFCAVLEDDAAFTNPERVSAIFEKVSTTDFDVFLLGTNMATGSPHTIPDLVRIKKSQTRTGYIVKRCFIPKLISLWKDSVPRLLQTGNCSFCGDQVWKKLMTEHTFIASPEPLAHQRISFSSIQGVAVDYSCTKRNVKLQAA